MTNNLTSFDDVYKVLPKVDLSDEGTFKYILIEVTHLKSKQTLEFVRGDTSCQYHMHILEKFKNSFEQKQLKLNGEDLQSSNGAVEFNCPGGGRIVHSKKDKQLKIYGYSQSFGQGNHDHVVQIMKPIMYYPNFEVSYEGY